MTKYGQEIETRHLDENSQIDYINNIKEFNVHTAFKRITVRVKVYNKKEEMTEFLTFSRMVEDAKDNNTLVRGDKDPTQRPSFYVEIPKHNNDGGYFIIRSITTLVL